jgi:hypothetical protein
MAEYTSEQYKFLLMKRLQRHFSMMNAADRIYTQNFFCALFDESVTVTEEAYNNFCRLMDDNLAFCAEKGWYKCEEINFNDEGAKEQSILLVNAFAEIGIALEIKSSTNTASFTKPNGKVMNYSADMTGKNYFYINARAGTEYRYAKASAPAYNMQGMDVPENLDGFKRAGDGTYWRYNEETKTVTISGEGTLGRVPEEQILGGKYTTVICGAGVSRLLENSIHVDGAVLVLLRPRDADMEIEPHFNASGGTCGGTDYKTVVYTDCAAAIAALSTEEQSKYVTLHSLSEWEG